MKQLNKKKAEEYASWFRCMGSGARLIVLNIVASADRAMTVGEIVDKVHLSQSTVSTHIKILAAEKFIYLEADGIKTLVRVNEKCMTALPQAAAEIMNFDRISKK